MVVFAIERGETPEEAILFFNIMDSKIKSKNILKSPFKDGSGVTIYKDFILFEFYNIYPNLVLISLLFIVPFIIFDLPGWILIGAAPFIFIGLFNTKAFYYLLLRLGLFKKGIKVKLKFLGDQETIRRLSKLARRQFLSSY